MATLAAPGGTNTKSRKSATSSSTATWRSAKLLGAVGLPSGSAAAPRAQIARCLWPCLSPRRRTDQPDPVPRGPRDHVALSRKSRSPPSLGGYSDIPGPGGLASRPHAHVPGNLTLGWPPPYSPALNPTERVWELIRRRCLHKQYFPELNAVVTGINLCLRNWSRLSPKTSRPCGITWRGQS